MIPQNLFFHASGVATSSDPSDPVGSIRAPSVAIIAAVGVGVPCAITSFSVHAPWSLTTALVPAAVAAVVDLRTRRVPDPMVIATALAALTAAVFVAGGDGLAAVLVGAAAAGLPYLTVHLVAPDQLGFGDVKLAAALGAVVGPIASAFQIQVLVGLALCALAAAVSLVAAAVLRRRDVPHAPALVAAAAVLLITPHLTGVVPT